MLGPSYSVPRLWHSSLRVEIGTGVIPNTKKKSSHISMSSTVFKNDIPMQHCKANWTNTVCSALLSYISNRSLSGVALLLCFTRNCSLPGAKIGGAIILRLSYDQFRSCMFFTSNDLAVNLTPLKISPGVSETSLNCKSAALST